MKRTLLVTLSALTLALTATPALAEKPTIAKSNQISPFNLVTRSYQGSFANQGIPSNGTFIRAAHLGKVSAEDLVQAAIAQGRLNPETLNDAEYIYNVQSYLDGLDND